MRPANSIASSSRHAASPCGWWPPPRKKSPTSPSPTPSKTAPPTSSSPPPSPTGPRPPSASTWSTPSAPTSPSTSAPTAPSDLFWAYDKHFGQAYGVTAEVARHSGRQRPRTRMLRYQNKDGKVAVRLAPGRVATRLTRHIIPGANLFDVLAVAHKPAKHDHPHRQGHRR